MLRIAGIDLPRVKRIEYALTKIYGSGLISSQQILEKTKKISDFWLDKGLSKYAITGNNIIIVEAIINSIKLFAWKKRLLQLERKK